MPWIDEYKKSGLSTTTTFLYDVSNGIHSTNTLGFQFYNLLTYSEENKISVRNDKNYLFKHTIYKVSTTNGPLRVNHFLKDDSVVYISDPDPLIEEDYIINTDGLDGNLIFNTYYDSIYDKQVNNICTYWFNELNSITSKHYIKNVKVEEIDFFINGYRVRTNDSNGWSYNSGQYSYDFDSTETENPVYPRTEMENIPFIGVKIPYNTFDIEFNYSKQSGGDVKIYLIESTEFEKWRTGSGTFSFIDTDKIETISSNVSSNLIKTKLNGIDKYIVIKVPSGDINFSISNIKIVGGYSNLNNSLTNSNSTIFNAVKYNNDYQYPYIGNGRFESGIWEDGVWNNGYRTDDSVIEFVDVKNAYPVTEGKWRISIKKETILGNTEKDLIGNYVSIGNIVAIDINENRKLLKSSYLVIDVIDDYIIVESEFSFPIRRIERDSNKHKIKVSKNIWLSGLFLNGVFEGIWNNGRTKGNPHNLIFRNTQWIDGFFDGGRFISGTNSGYQTGLIQNFIFNDNNISKKIGKSSTTNFKYNSWIDVNYDENQAVNIGSEIKIYDDISQKNVPKNNLYGYVTDDVLSSISSFRDSNTLNTKSYRLGTKYKIYTDFIGRSSVFNEPFDTDDDSGDFYTNGWTFSINATSSSSIGFENVEPDGDNIGKELTIKTEARGGVLNNNKINIERNRYSLVEFDLIKNDSIGVFGDNSIINYGSNSINYPVISFSNINNDSNLPISKNVNVLSNPNKKKIEYFFNKEKLNMNILGYGENMYQTSERKIIIDNLKFYEVDMIPFFKYFNENNIYRGVQTPLVRTSPFIDFTLNRYPFIENNYIPFESLL